MLLGLASSYKSTLTASKPEKDFPFLVPTPAFHDNFVHDHSMWFVDHRSVYAALVVKLRGDLADEGTKVAEPHDQAEDVAYGLSDRFAVLYRQQLGQFLRVGLEGLSRLQ